MQQDLMGVALEVVRLDDGSYVVFLPPDSNGKRVCTSARTNILDALAEAAEIVQQIFDALDKLAGATCQDLAVKA